MREHEPAYAARVSANAITRFERGEELEQRTVEAIQRALEAAGMQFIPENGDNTGVRLAERSLPVDDDKRPAGLSAENDD